ncbi:unnamed protein product [Rhizophagus irregularis]|nr:unnamed protein product [Rhizophagus irregularis]
MALSLFIAIDNNYKTRIVMQALTKYENQADFNWILECTLQATNDLQPKVLFTDSDPAIIAAVQLVTAIECELDKESQYTRMNDYYGSNPLVGLPLIYKTIFKELDSILQANLLPIPLSIQKAQMNQSLLYQGNLVSIDQVEEEEGNFNGILEHLYDTPQIRLRDLLNGISYNNITELWEVSYIGSKTSKSHYVAILKDSTILCTYNVYTPSIREKVSKKVQFGATMSVAKTSTEPLQESQGSSIQDNHQPLLILPEVSNPEYHRPKGRLPHKRYKSVVENDRVISGKSNETTVQKTCSYCSGKGHNIQDTRLNRPLIKKMNTRANNYIVGQCG